MSLLGLEPGSKCRQEAFRLTDLILFISFSGWLGKIFFLKKVEKSFNLNIFYPLWTRESFWVLFLVQESIELDVFAR